MESMKRLHPTWPSWLAVAAVIFSFLAARSTDADGRSSLIVGAIAGGALAIAIGGRLMHPRRSAEAKRVPAWLLAAKISLFLAILGYVIASNADALGGPRVASLAWGATVLFGVLGLFPLLLIETAVAPVSRNPAYEIRRVEHAWRRGIGLGLWFAFLLLANFLASRHDARADLALGSSTRPSADTVSAVRALDKELKVLLFYPPRNEVASVLNRYFDELRAYPQTCRSSASTRRSHEMMRRRRK
ncbi:MAG: hypothetical protein HC923_01950 [Myxococcales bacterium]|nr:hypothetical protein [Myxococcales bacterium]